MSGDEDDAPAGRATGEPTDRRPPLRGIELTPDRPVDRMAGLATRAEAAGFGTAFCSSHYNNRDPFVALSRVAAATDGIGLGPGVANPYEVHPVSLARSVATIDEASGGRAVLGIGPGDAATLSNLGIDRERPLRRVLEAVRVARRLWAGERVTHDGTFRAERAGLNFEPTGRIPVYVGAQGPDMLRMAGKHADGALVNGAHPRDLAWAADRIAEGLAERPAGRGSSGADGAAGTGDSFDALAYAATSVAEDPATAREAARRPVAFVAAGAPSPVLRRHGIDPALSDRIADAIGAGEFGRADELVTDELLSAFAVAGGPEDVAERYATLLEHADGVVVAAPLGPDPERAVELAGEALATAVE